MKNKKGEIATLLTLGLVVLGTLLTLGSSLFINNKKTNLASNPKAVNYCCYVNPSDKYNCNGVQKSVKNMGPYESACSANPVGSIAMVNCSTVPGYPTTAGGITCLGGGGGTTGDACSAAGGSCVSQSFSCTQVGGEPARSYCLSKAGQKCCESSTPTQPASGGTGGTTNADGSLIGSIGGCCFGYKQNTAAHTCADGQKYVRQYASADYMQNIADKPCTTEAYKSAYNAEWFDCSNIPNYPGGTFNGDGCYPPAGSPETTGGKEQPCQIDNYVNGSPHYGCDTGYICDNPYSSNGICVVDSSNTNNSNGGIVNPTCGKLYYCLTADGSCQPTSSDYNLDSQVQCGGGATCAQNLSAYPGLTTGICYKGYNSCVADGCSATSATPGSGTPAAGGVGAATPIPTSTPIPTPGVCYPANCPDPNQSVPYSYIVSGFQTNYYEGGGCDKTKNIVDKSYLENTYCNNYSRPMKAIFTINIDAASITNARQGSPYILRITNNSSQILKEQNIGKDQKIITVNFSAKNYSSYTGSFCYETTEVDYLACIGQTTCVPPYKQRCIPQTVPYSSDNQLNFTISN